MGAPQTLPADFQGWDKTPNGPPQTLPANFDQWDAPKAQSKDWSDSVSDFAKEVWNQVNPVSAVKGLAQATAHPIDTYKADLDARQGVYDQAKQDFKNGAYAGGAAKLLYSLVPMLGPQLNQAGDYFRSGEYAKGAGMSTGMGLALAGPEAVKGVNLKVPSTAIPERMYQSALKPSTTLGTEAVHNIVQTGLENKIPVSAAGAEKLTGLINDLSDKVKQQIQTGSNAGATIDPQAVATRADQIKSKFATQVNPNSDLSAIDAARQEFLNNNPSPIPAADAQAMKQGTYTQLKGKAYGELQSATIEAQKALARGIKEELEQQFPEIKSINAQQGRLIGLDGALDRAVNRINNHQLLGLGTPAAAAAGGVMTGTPMGAAAAAAMKMILDNPEVKSKLAIALNQSSKGGVSMNAAMARIAGYSDALGNAQPVDKQSQ